MAMIVVSADYDRPKVAKAAKGERPASVARSVVRRVYDALANANRRQAERDMARFVKTRGRFTDSLEREISERSMRSDWNVRD